MNKISKIIFVLVAALLLGIPTLTTNLKKDQMSYFDNRSLQEFPSLSDKNFRRLVERYASDRIGLRNEMITAYQYYCDALFHKLVHPSYIYGKGEHIIAPWDMVTFQHLDVSEEYLTTYTDYIKRLQNLCEQRDIGFLYALIPNKESIYPETFPDGYNVKEQPSRSDLILNLLDEKSVDYISPRELFYSLKSDNLLYNVKYDAGHWNDTGAFYAHQMIIDHIDQNYPGAGHLDLNEFDITEANPEYLAASYFRIDDTVPEYTLRQTDAVSGEEIFDQIAVTSPNQYHYYYKNETAARNGAPKVMIFGDSYLKTADRFYLNHCSELVLLHAEFMPNAEYYISVFQPDLVIYEAAERVLQGDWDKFKSSKEYYTLEDLSSTSQEGAPYAEEIILNADPVYLEHMCETQEFASVSGNLSELESELDSELDSELAEDPPQIKTLIAVLNGNEYYPHFDKTNTTSFTFSFRKEDILSGDDIAFYAVKEME